MLLSNVKSNQSKCQEYHRESQLCPNKPKVSVVNVKERLLNVKERS